MQFIALDTSSPNADVADLRNANGRQYDWLQQTLQAAHDDPSIDWTIVYMHHPIISHGLGISGHGGDRKLRVALVPLFEEWGVDLVAAGHEHHYERSTAVLGGRKVPSGCGPVYIIEGAAGASRYARGSGSFFGYGCCVSCPLVRRSDDRGRGHRGPNHQTGRQSAGRIPDPAIHGKGRFGVLGLIGRMRCRIPAVVMAALLGALQPGIASAQEVVPERSPEIARADSIRSAMTAERQSITMPRSTTVYLLWTGTTYEIVGLTH